MALFTSASMILTTRCNLRCDYCFESLNNVNHIDMDIDTTKKTIDMLVSNARESHKKHVSITFFGGEPLLCPELISDILVYCKDYQISSDITFSFDVITNCTIYNDNIEIIIFG